MLYRALAGGEWHEGTTVDVSASGALIVGDLPAPFEATVAVLIALPSHGCLVARGRVTRVPAYAARRGHAVFAIAVREFWLEHCSAALAHPENLHQGC